MEELGEGGGEGSEAAVPRLRGRHGRRHDGGEQASASVTKCEQRAADVKLRVQQVAGDSGRGLPSAQPSATPPCPPNCGIYGNAPSLPSQHG